MPRISYVNDRFVPHSQAVVHVEDRGYQFADAVYEVIGFTGLSLIDEALHFDRLARSLTEIRMEMPWSRQIFRMKIAELLRLNRLRDGALYLQVSRGVARRDHRLPKNVSPSVVMTVHPFRRPASEMLEQGVRVITREDQRWKRPDIKSVGLLPNVLAKDDALGAGAYETWLHDETGAITEGTSTNAWIIDQDGLIITRPADGSILNGVTRQSLLQTATGLGLEVRERTFTVDEARVAKEAFLTSTTALLLPVVGIDDAVIGNGKPGLHTLKLLDSYQRYFWQKS